MTHRLAESHHIRTLRQQENHPQRQTSCCLPDEMAQIMAQINVNKLFGSDLMFSSLMWPVNRCVDTLLPHRAARELVMW